MCQANAELSKNKQGKRLVVFSDLDGTLLDHDSYSYNDALEAMNALKKAGAKLVICTSKTRAEIEAFRKETSNSDPFVSENGGAIFIPKGYFSRELVESSLKSTDTRLSNASLKELDGYLVVELGYPYTKIVLALNELKAMGYNLLCFSDMDEEKVSELTGLPVSRAKLAKQREYDEAFICLEKNQEKIAELESHLSREGFKLTKGGRFYHLMGNSDKGLAVKILTTLYKKCFSEQEIITAAFGDSKNDFPMLLAADYGFLVQKKSRSYAKDAPEKAIKVDGIGPVGWNKAVLKLIKQLGLG